MTTAESTKSIRLKEKSNYPDEVTKWAHTYAEDLLVGTTLPDNISHYVQQASLDLARRTYHMTTLSLVTLEDNGIERAIPRSAKNAPLMQLLQVKHTEEYEAGKNPEWKPKIRKEEILTQRLKTAFTAIERGIPLPNGQHIPGIGNSTTMQDALLQEWEVRHNDNEHDNLFRREIAEKAQPPYDFFWQLLAHHNTRDMSKGHLREFEGGTLPLPTMILDDTTDEDPLLYNNEELTLALLDTQLLIEEEGALQAHCVGGYDIFSESKSGKKNTYIFSLYKNTPETSMRMQAVDTDSSYYNSAYDNIHTKRKPVVTIEYDANTRGVRQVKLAENVQVTRQSDPLYPALFQALQRLDHWAYVESMPIKSFSGDLNAIEHTKPFLTLKGEEKDIADLEADDVIVSGGTINVREDISTTDLQHLASLSNVSLDVTNLLNKQPKAFDTIMHVRGNLVYRRLYAPEGLTLPESVGGHLGLRSLTSAEGLTFPESVGGHLDLESLTSAEGLTLPESVGDSIYLDALSENEKEKLRRAYPYLRII
jgi:hypothetical protein